jgi:formate-dependent nitrite reductase membrane component NrfD
VLAFSPSIPFWNTTLIPLQFLSFAFASALGLALIFALWIPVPAAMLASWLAAELFLLAATALLFIAHLLNGNSSHTVSKLSVKRLMSGEQRASFLLGTVVVGLAAPGLVILYGLLMQNASPPLIFFIGATTLVGNWFSKYAVIKAGVFAPFF